LGVRVPPSALRRELPNLSLLAEPSGTKVLDWEVPLEWGVSAAYIKTPTGKKICDFSLNNLFLVGYSRSFQGKLSLEELQPHLYSLPDQRQAVPYVTSYYADNWGFCISQEEREKLEEGIYEVRIDAQLKHGSLDFADLLIPGESPKEIVFSTYICHPSMANNELSGPVLATELAKLLSGSSNYYSYRFIFVPETIGSLTYLSRNLTHMKEKVLAGFVLTCVGDERAYSYLPSRTGNTASDHAVIQVARQLGIKLIEYSWLDRGSDERQYCSPGIDLPFCSLMRSKYGEYPEYHTDLDTLGNVVTQEGLQGSFKFYSQVINYFESRRFPKISVLGEPQLGKRGLYPNLSIKGGHSGTRDIVNILSVADGTKSREQISDYLSLPLEYVARIISDLKYHSLLEE
jgi:aminopeptidase-like protein